MDTDTSACIQALNEALAKSGLTQAAFAAALGTSASRLSTYRSGKVSPTATFFLRATRIAQNLHDARQRGWMTSPRAASAIADALRQTDEMWAFKMALQGRDHLRQLLHESPDLRGAWEAAPPSTGSEEWNTLLAALAAHEFQEAGHDAPRWTHRPALPRPWTLDSPRLTETQIHEQTPDWLAEWRIFATARDLATE